MSRIDVSAKQLHLMEFGEERIPKQYPRLWDMYRAWGRTKGKKCKDCRFLLRFVRGAKWMKCEKSFRTSSSVTDWRAGWPACGLWERVAKDEDQREGSKEHVAEIESPASGRGNVDPKSEAT